MSKSPMTQIVEIFLPKLQDIEAIVQYLDKKEGYETKFFVEEDDVFSLTKKEKDCQHCFCKFNIYTSTPYCCECGKEE